MELTLQVSTLYDMTGPSYHILDIVKLGLVQKKNCTCYCIPVPFLIAKKLKPTEYVKVERAA